MIRYNWGKVQKYYNKGYSYRQCKGKFKFSPAAWSAAVKRGDIKVRSWKERFIQNLNKKRKCSHATKLLLIKYGLKSYQCEQCKLVQWQNKPIPLELHHINGDYENNNFINLEILCPNCHAQTNNYGTRNRKF